MGKYFFWVIIIIVIIFGGTFGLHFIINKKIAEKLSDRETRPVISTTKVTQAQYQPTMSAVGSIAAVQGINLTSQVNGQVQEILFKYGSFVKKNDLLVQLDPKLAQQQYDQSLATLTYDKSNYDRQTELMSQDAAIQNTVDQSKATYLAQKAQVEINKLNLSYTSIKAPFSGRIGLSQVNVGQYITPSITIASLQQMDPILVEFPVGGDNIEKIYTGQTVNVAVESQPGKTFTGKVSAVDSEISKQTRTINIQAQLANKDSLLIPGQFANVEILLNKKEDVIEIPRTAIVYSLYGNQTFVVTTTKNDSGKSITKVEAVMVTTGAVDGDNVVITDGLKAGDVIVNAGQNKLTSGQEVLINNAVKLN